MSTHPRILVLCSIASIAPLWVRMLNELDNREFRFHEVQKERLGITGFDFASPEEYRPEALPEPKPKPYYRQFEKRGRAR